MLFRSSTFAISMVSVNFTWLVLLLQAQNFLVVQLLVAQVLQKLRVHRLDLLQAQKVQLAQKVHQNLLQTQVVLRVNRQVSLHDRPTITLVQQTLHHQLNPTHKLKIKQQTVEIHHNKVTKYPSTDMDRLVNTPLSNVEECFFTQKQHHQLIQIKKTTRIFLNNSSGLL